MACALCSNPFRDPRLLPCLHVFCEPCLGSLREQNKGVLTCPTCHAICSQPTKSLPRHLRIQKQTFLAAICSRSSACELCDSGKSVQAFCDTCESGICSDCVLLHGKIKPMKTHEVVRIEKQYASSMKLKTAKCFTHTDEVLKYYCSTCGDLVCIECILVGHKDHKYSLVDSAENQERKDLKALLPHLEIKLPTIQESITTIVSTSKAVVSKKEEVKASIKKAFEEFTHQVSRREDELLREVDEITISKLTQLELQKEDLEKLASSAVNALGSSTEALNSYSPQEFLAIKSSLKVATSNSIEKIGTTPLVPLQIDNIKFHDADLSELRDRVSNLGNVSSSAVYPSLCSLVGINPNQPIGVPKNSKLVLTLQTRDSKGEDVMVEVPDVKAKLLNPISELEVSECECKVTYVDNGRYKVSFNNRAKGQHKLYLSVDSIAINGSPFTISVRDYGEIGSIRRQMNCGKGVSHLYVDRSLNCFVTCNDGSVLIFNQNQQKVKEIPGSKLGIKVARGIAVDEDDGVMFICDHDNNRIVKATIDGRVISKTGVVFNRPMGLCMTQQKHLLVVDNGGSQIEVLDNDLSYLKSIPCENSYGIAVDSVGNIHADSQYELCIYTIDGTKLSRYGEGNASNVGDIACLGDYSIVSCAEDHGKILIFEYSTGTLVGSFRVSGGVPFGVCIDQAGMIYVADSKQQTVNVY